MAKEKLIWVAEKDYSNKVVQIYACCPKHAFELLNRKHGKNAAHPTFYTRISQHQANEILNREMGWDAYADRCDLCTDD